MEPSDNQKDNTDKPWLWKKGQSGNLMGRPKGKTMKEYAREYLSKMTDEERDEWFDGINKELVWKMGEGNPDNKVQGDSDNPITLIVKNVNGNSNTQELRIQGIPKGTPGSTPEI